MPRVSRRALPPAAPPGLGDVRQSLARRWDRTAGQIPGTITGAYPGRQPIDNGKDGESNQPCVSRGLVVRLTAAGGSVKAQPQGLSDVAGDALVKLDASVELRDEAPSRREPQTGAIAGGCGGSPLRLRTRSIGTASVIEDVLPIGSALRSRDERRLPRRGQLRRLDPPRVNVQCSMRNGPSASPAGTSKYEPSAISTQRPAWTRPPHRQAPASGGAPLNSLPPYPVPAKRPRLRILMGPTRERGPRFEVLRGSIPAAQSVCSYPAWG